MDFREKARRLALALAGMTICASAAPLPSRAPAAAPTMMGTPGTDASAAMMLPGDAPAATPRWSDDALHQLLAAVEGARDEGLRPQDYQRDMIADLIARHDESPARDALAERAARALAHDYAEGRVRDHARFNWHIERDPAELAALESGLDPAVRADRVADYFQSLLPRDARYQALRDALRDSDPSDLDRVRAIRASMERWRWMPRTLGDRYILVNVPAYRLDLVEDGAVTADHVVVVGAPKTPTPMIASYANAVVVNPWWTLPPTVLAEGKRYSPERGFVTRVVGGRAMIRQKPGPNNALGRVKIDMPNPYAIYLHDTPAKAAFARSDRALSHGCIRVKGIAQLAEALAEDGRVDMALDDEATQTLQLEKSVPVYIAYFTAGTDAEGQFHTFGDPYAQDSALIEALDGSETETMHLASAAP
ncbi:L,D-transpeptidase family protein [Sphingomonas morindae]|uniref:L,D-transpeptidase family protein n=1 Tax=Sphingomonas morindae TaxID=1541170 RepID=A0ABY4X4Z2_9SPHN|nr:L,D-transpeptidase family protein [Sphingomonas morindae]USI71967.1 L,D-transpeptidase family protein [Sphingomonas morindae]